MSFPSISPDVHLLHQIRQTLHVRGARGVTERYYPTAAITSGFPGLFEDYVASVILHWQEVRDDRLRRLDNQLSRLSLTSRIEALRLDETRIDLRVGRLLKPGRSGNRDLVSVADVGLGVKHALPVLVSLLVAEPGEIVYVEQPEIHLHPRAQVGLAGIMIAASKRGVRVVVETHSDLLLRAIQTAAAKGDISTEDVILHWFSRNAKTGATRVDSAGLSEAGAFGEWPEDFGDVYLQAEGDYLKAAAKARRIAKPQSIAK